MAIKIIKKRGETIRKRITLKYRNGTPVNLTGYTAKAEMRTKPGDTLVATGICSIDRLNGIVDVIFTNTQTAALSTGTYGYDVWLNGQGDKYCIQTVIVEIIDRYTEA